MSGDDGQGYSADDELRKAGPAGRGKRLLGGVVITLMFVVLAVAMVAVVVFVTWGAFRIATWLGMVVLVVEVAAGLYCRGSVLASGRSGR
ncbi:hypothetical protein ACFU7Y_42555 [Kitasatospora sp. NPDC057542]|uniref:hypothetical protein n=1 Tax=Kitasatospora sp. NPDC057542 TaxID=3346162 RepID=UPI003698A29C